jgi:predicted site-specific integrase-resolvase
MAETHKDGARRAIKVPEFLKDQLEQAQARIALLEEGAEKALKDLMQKGRASRKDLEAVLVKLSKDDRLSDLRVKLEKLQRTGAVRAEEWKDRAEEWKDRAESFRAEALERIVELQGKAVSFLGVATKEEVDELHRELDRLAKRFEKGQKARPARKGGKKAEA